MDTIKLTGYPEPVLTNSIVWLEAEANYTRLYYQSGRFDLVTQPLQWFEHHLNFVRVSRSAMVNPLYVEAFDQKRGRSGWVRLAKGQLISVSRSRLDLVVAQLKDINFIAPLSNSI